MLFASMCTPSEVRNGWESDHTRAQGWRQTILFGSPSSSRLRCWLVLRICWPPSRTLPPPRHPQRKQVVFEVLESPRESDYGDDTICGNLTLT